MFECMISCLIESMNHSTSKNQLLTLNFLCTVKRLIINNGCATKHICKVQINIKQ